MWTLVQPLEQRDSDLVEAMVVECLKMQAVQWPMDRSVSRWVQYTPTVICLPLICLLVVGPQ